MTTEHPLLLQARGLKKSYGSKPALKGVDLQLRAGEMLGCPSKARWTWT